MTSSEDFAQKRIEAERLIRQHAPVQLHEQLISLLRPAIALNTTRVDDTEIPVGASKFGGAPDVPEGFEWPTWNNKPLGFLAQINLEEVAPFDVERLLPRRGMLAFFFFPYDYGYAENDATMRLSWRVLHFSKVSHRASEPSELDTVYAEVVNSCTTIPQAEWTLPEFFDAELDLDDVEQIGVLFEKFYRAQPRHRLLGWYNPAQGNLIEELCADYAGELDWSHQEQSLERIRQWRLLLQVDADHKAIGCEWGDMGSLFFMIRQRDLDAHHFEDVWLVHECG